MTDAVIPDMLPSPKLRYDPFTNRFVLIEPFVTPEYTVPVGEYTDGATRPELASGTKQEADALFETNLIRCNKQFGFNPELIPLMVTAVTLFGKGAY